MPVDRLVFFFNSPSPSLGSMAFNYQINITAVSRAEEVLVRIEKLFAGINAAMDKLTAANKAAEEAAKGAAEGVRGVGDAAEDSAKKSVNLSTTIATGMIKAQAAIALVSRAVDFMKGKFMEAADIQLQNISASSTFASLSGQSYEEAAKFTDNFNIRISKAAASLPGSTAGYAQLARVIGDSVVPAFKDVNGQLDTKSYEEGLFQLVQTYGAVAAGGNIDIGNTALGLTKAFSGSSTAELRQIQIFEQNPVILSSIEAALKEKGAKSFKDVDQATRLEILTNAAKQMITDDFIKRSSDSVSGLMEGFNSAIFDPSTGLFGVFRDLDEEVAGSQTAFQSFNDLLVRLLGGDGVFGQLQEFMQAMNLPDPMRVVKSGLDFAVSVLDQIIRVMKDINILVASGYNIFQVIQYLANDYFNEFTDFPSFIRETFDSFLDVIEVFLVGFDGEIAGAALADGLDAIVNWFGELFSGMILDFDGSEDSFANRIGMIASDFTFDMIITFASFFRNLDSGTWLTIASGALAAFLVPAMITALAATGTALIAGVPALLVLAAVAAFAALGKVIFDNKAAILEQMQPFLDVIGDIGQTLYYLAKIILDVFLGDWGAAFDSAKLAAISIGALMQSTVAVFKAMYDTFVTIANPILQTLGQSTLQTTGQQQAAQAEQVSQFRFAAATYGYGDGGGRWQGHIPSAIPAFEGLFSAAAQESSKMPSGAELAIANTSEAILTPAMLRNLVSGSVSLGASGVSGGNQITNNFSISGVSDPDAVAQRVLTLLDKYLSDEMQGQIA